MAGLKSFRLLGGQRIDPPTRLASDYSPEELARFRKGFELETKRDTSRGLILFVLVAPLIIINLAGSAFGVWGHEWRFGGFVLGAIAILFLLTLTGKVACPACKRSLDASGEFCPECGRRELQPGSWRGAPKCSLCQKTMTTGKHGRGYRVRACTHCGLMLDEDLHCPQNPMRDVYSNPEPARVGYFQSVLESAGIACFVRNQVSSNLVAGMSSTLLAPVLCVVEDEDYEKAVALIREAVYPAEDENSADWECPSCKQVVPGTFAVCWNCQHERAGPSAYPSVT